MCMEEFMLLFSEVLPIFSVSKIIVFFIFFVIPKRVVNIIKVDFDLC